MPELTEAQKRTLEKLKKDYERLQDLPPEKRKPVANPEKYDFPIGLDDDGEPFESDESVKVRTVTELQVVLELRGHDPSTGTFEAIAPGQVRWRPATGKPFRFWIAHPQAPALDLGDGRSEVLTAADLRRQALAVERSVPSQPALLGAYYLERVIERLRLAIACLEQAARFPEADRAAVESDAARIRHTLDTMVAAREAVGPVPAPSDLPHAPGTYVLPEAERAHLPTPPYAAETLTALAQRGWGPVVDHLPDHPEVGLLRHESGAVLLIRLQDDASVTEQRLEEGERALHALAAHGCRLTAEVRGPLLAAFVPGDSVDIAEAPLGELPVAFRPITRVEAGDDREHRFYLLEQRAPRRRLALLATVVRDRTLLGRHLIEGPAVIDQLARLMRREVGQHADDPIARAMASLDEVREQLRARLLPFVEPGADLAALTEALRPRPGDAAKVFADAATAAKVEATVNALWNLSPPVLAPKPGQSDVQIHLCPAGMLGQENALSAELPGGLRALAPLLWPHRVWAIVRFVAPGSRRGMHYPALVWIDDHWAWFPKPWRLTPGITEG